jgi:plasmid stabilization system protein ParE
VIERLSLEEWLAFDRAYPAPTFFARPPWAMALSETYGALEIAPMRIQIKGRPAVLIPLVRVGGGALRWKAYNGFPLGGYTCVMEENGSLADSDLCLAALQHLAAHADAVTAVPWPLAHTLPGQAAKRHETSVLDLSGGTEAALARVPGLFRRMAGQAERRGVECAAARGEDAADRYYALLEASARRWGLRTPRTPKALIISLRRHGGDDVEIWFARAGGIDVAGGLVFYGAQELFFWSAAMLSEYGRLRPSNALNFALIQSAAERGMRWYNLGASEGLPGVARFKKDLGASPIIYSDLHISRTHYKVYANMRRAFGRRSA